jgi:secernin
MSRFLIADRKEAYILETHFSAWAWKRVRGFAVISNKYSITDDWHEISPSLASDDLKAKRFNFSSFSDWTHTTTSQAASRKTAIENAISVHKGHFQPSHAMSILRSHQTGTTQEFDPANGCFSQSVCMHYAGYIRRAQTTGSIISHLCLPFGEEKSLLDTIWTTGTSAACISSFKPLIGIDSLPSDLLGVSNQIYDGYSFWWRGEELHRLILLDYPNRAPLIQLANRELEADALEEINRFGDRTPEGDAALDALRKEIALKYFTRSLTIMRQLTASLASRKRKALSCISLFTIWYRFNWQKRNALSYLKPVSAIWPVWALPTELLTLSILGVGFLVIRRRFSSR